MKEIHKNIFWHQGIKIFEEEFLKKKEGQIKITHFENDVTKSLLNIFQLTDHKVLQKFLSLINVKDSADTFEFDFQIFDSNRYRILPNRIMLSIVSSSTTTISDSNYSKIFSIPDAAIYNDHTVVLIESKTQSPLNLEQLSSHIKHFLGSTTNDKIITWEEIAVIFNEILKKEKTSNAFLLHHFIDFLEIIDVSDFSGFRKNDFETLSLISMLPKAEYLEYRRIFIKKVEKFMQSLNKVLPNLLNSYNYSWKCAKINLDVESDWSAFYFTSGIDKIHVNKFPNINFNYRPYGIELALNSETKPSVKYLLNKIILNEKLFYEAFNKLDDFNLSLFYKIQYRPKDNFYWDLIFGYPKKLNEISFDELKNDLIFTKNNWENIKKTFLHKITNGDIRKADNNYFTEKEIEFTKVRNPNPNYAIRINKKYNSTEIDANRKGQIVFFANEIKKLINIIEILFRDTKIKV